VATRTFQRRPAPNDPQKRITDLVARHETLLLRVARRWSLCADDAQDAYQRALEIYIRRVDSLDPATETAWLKVVIRNEALAIRRARQDSVTGEEIDFDSRAPAGQRSTEDRFESSERVARSAEIIRRLKPDEAKALMLKAEGLSYEEIGSRLGWSYTKVNRCITEGRRRFMRLYEQLETGAACERFAPTLLALANGTASKDAILEIRPHLRNCGACRATVREFHVSLRRRLAAYLPLPALVEPLRRWIERLKGTQSAAAQQSPLEIDGVESQRQFDEFYRRLDAYAATQPAAPAALEHASRLAHARLNLRAHFEALVQRLQSSDLVVGLHLGGGGSGRVASIAAILGICVSSTGAGTYCVVTALLPDDPKPIVRTKAKPKKVVEQPRLASAPATETRSASLIHTPVRRAKQRRDSNAGRTTPVSHEQPPISPAPAGQQDFSFEQSATSAALKPAAAPATGGGEFGP
jgi:RNA polymerase sigma factor (sigma-70 family)